MSEKDAPSSLGQDSGSSHDAVQTQERGDEYTLAGANLALVMIGLSLAVFLMAIDTSIVATAIPKITSQFSSTKDIGWYGSAYAVALCALQPLGGKLYTNFSLKGVFLSFFAIFELGSLLCGVAKSSNMLIVGRAIAGAGGTGIGSGALSIVGASLPLRKRPLFIGILQSIFAMATMLGPIIGGALTQRVSWRWCFYINLPAGSLTFISLVFFFHPPDRKSASGSVMERIMRLDLIGAILFIPSIVMVLLALQWGGTVYAWKSSRIIGLFIGFGGMLSVFIAWQLRQGDKGMIPPKLMAQRTILAATISIFFAMGTMLTTVYFVPEWFQVIKGASPIRSGVMYLPTSVAQILSANFTGFLVMKLGYYNPYMLTGTVLMAVGSGLMSTFNVSTSHQHWIPYQVLMGLGTGMVTTMPLIAVQTVVRGDQIPVVTAMVILFQFFGGSVWLAVAQAVFQNKLVNSLSILGRETGGAIDPGKILQIGVGAVREAVAKDLLPRVIVAFNEAITSTMYVAAATAAAGLVGASFLEWNSVKGKNLIPGGDA